MDSAMRAHPCHQPSYTKKRQVLAEEEEEDLRKILFKKKIIFNKQNG